jgi:hypothetical protein
MKQCDVAGMVRRCILRAGRMSAHPRAKLSFYAGVLHAVTDLHENACDTERERRFLAEYAKRLKALTLAQIFDLSEGT